jgi:hypothetical protein
VNVYAFEWCDCVYESAFSVVSIHASKLGAYRAMKAKLWDHAASERDMQQSGYAAYRDTSVASRIRTIEVQQP